MTRGIRNRHAASPVDGSTLRAVVSAALASLLVVVLAVPVALAASPHRLAGPITDDVGVLSGRTDEIQTRLNALQAATGSQAAAAPKIRPRSRSGTSSR